jgi:hypothetical protein
MAVFEPLDRRVTHLGFIDVKLLTSAAFLTGLLAAKLLPEVLAADVRWYAGLALACAFHPMWLLLTRPSRRRTT